MWQANGAARMNQWASGPLLDRGRPRDSTDKPLFAIAVNFAKNNFFNAHHRQRPDNTSWGGDDIFKYKGFSSVGEYYMRESEAATTGPEFDDKGFHVQALVRLQGAELARRAFWEVAGRYATFDPTASSTATTRRRSGGALSYYYNRHNLKVQADYRQIENEAANSGAGRRTRSSASRPSSFSEARSCYTQTLTRANGRASVIDATSTR